MDFIRGISAVFVCAGHLRAVMFVDYSTLETGTFIEKVFYFLTSLGHEAVMVFFVLSGFFVGGSVLSKKLNFSFDGYLIARLSRLWTVLIPALLFTLLIDKITEAYYPAVLMGEYYSQITSGPSENYSSSIFTFLANISFLQNIYSPVFGSNGPLWSLTNEFWYYITFPLGMILLGVINMSKVYRVIFSVAFFVAFYFFTQYVFGGFIIWLFGVIVFLIYQKEMLNYGYWFTLSTLIVFVFSLIISKSSFFTLLIPISTDFVVGISFSLFLISLRNIENTAWVEKYLSKLSFWFSDISYTLYVIHFPVMILIYSRFYKNKQMELSPIALLEYVGWLVMIILFSRIFWYVFERNTSIIRNIMFKIRH